MKEFNFYIHKIKKTVQGHNDKSIFVETEFESAFPRFEGSESKLREYVANHIHLDDGIKTLKYIEVTGYEDIFSRKDLYRAYASDGDEPKERKAAWFIDDREQGSSNEL